MALTKAELSELIWLAVNGSVPSIESKPDRREVDKIMEMALADAIDRQRKADTRATRLPAAIAQPPSTFLYPLNGLALTYSEENMASMVTLPNTELQYDAGAGIQSVTPFKNPDRSITKISASTARGPMIWLKDLVVYWMENRNLFVRWNNPRLEKDKGKPQFSAISVLLALPTSNDTDTIPEALGWAVLTYVTQFFQGSFGQFDKRRDRITDGDPKPKV